MRTAERPVEVFINEAAHALRTPLTVVRGHLQLLDVDSSERAETIRVVLDELTRMSHLIDDLLLLSRADQPDFMHVAPVALGELTDEIYGRAEQLAPRRWRLDGLATAEINADRDRLTTAMLALATNAVDSTEPGSEIGIGSAVDDDEARLWVRDSGCGVEPGDETRVFERFARGLDSRRRSRGFGLGLAVALAIIDGHGGRIELDNRPGEGATFTLVVPRHGPS